MKNKLHIPFFLLIHLILSALLLTSCSDSSEKSAPPPFPEDEASSFSFFDVTRHTILSKALRNRLNTLLGNEAVETRTTIDLTINSDSFFQTHFSHFYQLNKKLNSETGERVEHNTVNIVFRYAETRGLPFEYVGFLFSDDTKRPLMIKARFKTDDLNIKTRLYNEYGKAETIMWNRKKGKSLCWRKDMDILVLSFVPDEFGNIEYELVIYFAHALEALVDKEHEEKEKKINPPLFSNKTP
ncbi:MAG: hypothetical protein U9P10_09200 [Thermodesulfobacteriota bacterium]|nr:hypothetical protein [Thermodesulfobacteriota bacterium]